MLRAASVPVSPDVDVASITDRGHARNSINVLSSDAVVACGRGGPGTVSEVALARKAGKPVILLGADAISQACFQRLGGDAVHRALMPPQAIELIRWAWSCRD